MSEDLEASAGSRVSSGLGTGAGKRRTAPLPLPVLDTEPGLVPPDPEALTPSSGFSGLILFRFQSHSLLASS